MPETQQVECKCLMNMNLLWKMHVWWQTSDQTPPAPRPILPDLLTFFQVFKKLPVFIRDDDSSSVIFLTDQL
jgi:hypothetical protein